MIPGVILDPPPLRPLTRLSPSRYALLRTCALREIWMADSSPSLLPRSPMTILGLVAHRLLRDAGQVSEDGNFDAEKKWKQLTETMDQELRQSWLESTLYPLQSTAPMYEVLKKRTCSRATQIASISKKRRSSTTTYRRSGTGFEVWVESRDKAVGGLIDTVKRIDNQIVLSDFKTGDVLEQLEGITSLHVNESYAAQLKLYAALYEQTFRVWPARLQLVPLTGATRDVPFTETECAELLREASLAFRTLNARIVDAPKRHADFASPSPLSCRFCIFRPACHAYQSAPKKASQKWPLDSVGQLWDMNVLRDGRINLRITTDAREDVIFRALSPCRHPVLKALQRGDRVGIFNGRTSSGKAEFAEGPLTVLYKFAGSFLSER